jgi:hypothetical protein
MGAVTSRELAQQLHGMVPAGTLEQQGVCGTSCCGAWSAATEAVVAASAHCPLHR